MPIEIAKIITINTIPMKLRLEDDEHFGVQFALCNQHIMSSWKIHV